MYTGTRSYDGSYGPIVIESTMDVTYKPSLYCQSYVFQYEQTDLEYSIGTAPIMLDPVLLECSGDPGFDWEIGFNYTVWTITFTDADTGEAIP